VLQVNGTLKARGNSSSTILFDTTPTSSAPQIVFRASSTDWNATDSTGCIMENATINTPISINGSAPIITDCKIKGGIIIVQASPIIQRNIISGGSTTEAVSIENESSPTIIANNITGKTVGISLNLQNTSLTNTYNAIIQNNTIMNCVTGIGVGNSNGTILVYANLIFGSTSAVKIANTSATVNLVYNLIMNNTHGIDVGTGININKNTIYNNTIGIYYDTKGLSSISYNNIMNNTQYNIEVTINSPTLLDATYNYWGSQSIPYINSTIYDNNDNSSLGTVKYLPALPEPNTEAPMIQGVDMYPSPLPTPTPIPTLTPSPTVKPTTKPTATPTPTPAVTQGQFGALEIAVIAALIVIIVVFLIVVLRRTDKKSQNPPLTPT
jgi:hypothetical protein